MHFPLGRKVVGTWGSLPGALFSGCLAVLLGSGTQRGLGVCICPHTCGRTLRATHTCGRASMCGSHTWQGPAYGSHTWQGPCVWLHVGPQEGVRLMLKAVQLPAWMGAARPLPTASQGPCFLADAQRASVKRGPSSATAPFLVAPRGNPGRRRGQASKTEMLS